MEERGDEKEVQLNDKNYIEKKSTEKRKEDLVEDKENNKTKNQRKGSQKEMRVSVEILVRLYVWFIRYFKIPKLGHGRPSFKIILVSKYTTTQKRIFRAIQQY